MTDVDAFVDELRQVAIDRGNVRVRLPEVRAVFDRAAGRAAERPDSRQQLADLLHTAAEQGLLELSKSLDRATEPALPRFVLFDDARRPRSLPPQIAWRPELSWVPTELSRLTEAQIDMLAKVNVWLRDGGHRRPLVPTAERSVELFDDEKAIDKRRGGRRLWQDRRLTHRLLRCASIVTPLVWEPAGTGGRMLLVENQATYASALRVLRERPGSRFGTVAWGQGNQAASRLPWVANLPETPSTIEYFGDLDVDGLTIAAGLTARAAADALPDVVPCVELYELLAECRDAPAEGTAPSEERSTQLSDWLPEHLRAWSTQLLSSGRRVAQERVGYELMSASTGWADQ